MTNACYECGEPVPAAEMEAFARAVAEWQSSAVSGDLARE